MAIASWLRSQWSLRVGASTYLRCILWGLCWCDASASWGLSSSSSWCSCLTYRAHQVNIMPILIIIIVGKGFKSVTYLPGKILAISAHLLPNFLWDSNITFSSLALIGSFLISGSKWLCHLHIVNCLLCLPLSALLASATINSVVFFQLLSNECPPLGSVLPHQLLDCFILLSDKVLMGAHKRDDLQTKSKAFWK